MTECREKPIIGIGSTGAEQLDERNLRAAFPRDAPRTNQPECFVQRRLVHTVVKNDFGDSDDVLRHAAAADGIFRDEFEQRGIAEVVAALEANPLPRQLRVQPQVGAQSGLVAGVHQIDGAAEKGILDALMMGQVEPVGGRGPFDARLEPRPSGEAMLAGDGELRIAEFYCGGKNLGVGSAGEARMELANKLG
ncbi:MAG: hypothetical protein ABSF53_18580 [Terracidiphilus sp.]